MKWFHGEVSLEDGLVVQFRYSADEFVQRVDFITTIQERLLLGSTVLWIEEGFTPSNPSRWDKWLLNEPDDLSQFEVVFLLP